MIGGFPPTQYRITLSGKDPMFPEHQNSSSQRINVTFDLLNPGQVYNISIACSIQGIDCPGPVQYIQATTNCTAPDSIEPLNIDCQQPTDGFPIYWNCTANWTRANANCPGNVRYLYGINGTYTNETDKNSVIFSLNGHQLYNFIVKARNSENIVSASVNKSQQSGVLEPVSGPRAEETTSNGTCVYVSWNPPNSRDANGEIIAYRHRCTNRTAWNETVSTSLEYCGYEPEQSVTCEIQASTSKGFGPSTTVSAIIQCTEPPQPHFNIASFKNTSASASLIIILEKSQSLCPSVPYYIIKVQHLNGSVIYQDTVLTSGNFVIQNLSGFTTYIVTVEVRIGDNLKSETSLTVLTVETEVPGEPHIEHLTSTPSCVFINASKPLDPNGVITAYLFSCQPNPETVIDVPPTATHVVTQLCGLPSSSLINCSVRAVNSIGTGMPVYVSTYTELKLLFSSPPKLLSLDASKPAFVRVKIFEVETERNDTNIRSYLVLLQDSEVTKAEDSEPIVCDVVKGNCMTAAEIENNVVTTDGYIFYIGDGNEYGEYINRPLTPGNSYILQLAISVQLFSGDDVYYQTIAGMTSITVPSAFCEPPPIIANAIVGNSSKAKVGQEVLYACDDGYQRTSGNYQLTCTITKSYETLWTGEHPNCSKTQGVAIGLGVATLAVILAVGILVVYLKWKKQPFSESESSPAQSGNSGDYMVPARAKPSEYSSLELRVDSRVCRYDSCEGELVGKNPIGEDAYETVSYE
ncbi:protogenin-like [Watersipora subatra]|uniref:protogenin-like n=1 Tax=Watersipora subatra TaxID=2589382 RepID=UPI00355C2B6A